jgi:peroxiredoxin Q/BCP
MTQALKVGDKAPAFKLEDQDGKTVSLSDLKGKKVVLYFYPKDDTPGCTIEACAFRDDIARYRKAGAEVIGVSFDSPESHTKFREKYDLPFTLLADEEKKLANAYGVYVEKNMYGKKSMGIQRSTFVIDPAGRIAAIFPKVRPEGHSAEVLDALKRLG